MTKKKKVNPKKSFLKKVKKFQFIDNKGRLFGKINAIDFLVILFVILIVTALVKYVWYNDPEIENITFTFESSNVNIYNHKQFLKNDTFMYKNTKVKIIEASHNMLTGKYTFLMNMDVTIKANKKYINNEKFVVGKKITLDLGDMELSGTIRELEPDTNWEEIYIKGLISGVHETFLESYPVYHEDQYVKIYDMEVNPHLVMATNMYGNVYEQKHPYKWDIIIYMKLRVKKTKGYYTYLGQIIQKNKNLKVFTKKLVYDMTVIEFKETKIENPTSLIRFYDGNETEFFIFDSNIVKSKNTKYCNYPTECIENMNLSGCSYDKCNWCCCNEYACSCTLNQCFEGESWEAILNQTN